MVRLLWLFRLVREVRIFQMSEMIQVVRVLLWELVRVVPQFGQTRRGGSDKPARELIKR